MSNQDIKIGDRVRAVSRTSEESGLVDSAEFTVTNIQTRSGRLLSRYSVYGPEDYTFTVLDRPVPPLPTTPGLYGLGSSGTRYLMLTNKGQWFWVDFTTTSPDPTPVAPKMVAIYVEKHVTLLYEFGSEHKR